MIVFKSENDPRRNHIIQIWQTPYIGKNYVTEGDKDSLLFKIGNKDIVNAMADCRGVYKLIQKGEGYQSIYVDIVRESERIIDSYFWLDKEEVFIQIWQTPYIGKNYVTEGDKDSLLFKIGNKDIVNAMADCRGVYKLIKKGEGYQSIYVDIVRESERIIDSYFWLDKEEVFNLKEVLLNIKESSTFAIGEFEKVTRIKTSTKKQIEGVSKRAEELLNNLKYGSFDSINEYVKALADIRNLRGEISSLKDLRYADLKIVNSLDLNVKEKYEEFSKKCVEFLIHPDGLKPYEEKVKELGLKIDKVNKSMDGKDLEKGMDDLKRVWMKHQVNLNFLLI